MKMLEKITSRDNPKIKLARRVREGMETHLIFIEGVRLAEEALRSDVTVTQAFFTDEFSQKLRNRELLDKTIDRAVDGFEVPDRVFSSIADTDSSQGIILLAERPKHSRALVERRLSTPGSLPLVLFLHEVNNPSNLGAILRTGEAAGVAGVIVSKGSADVFSAKSIRASMGSAFRLPTVQNAEIDDILAWADSIGLRSTAADIRAATAYTGIDWRIPRLLVFGSEAHGLSVDDTSRIEELTCIPMQDYVESLNLAVSCGIILFEAVRQHSST